MKPKHIGIIAARTLGLAFSVLVCAGALRAARQDAALRVEAGPKEFMLKMASGGPLMTIPRQGLSDGRKESPESAKHPGYFAFQDSEAGIIVSGWFEAQQHCPGAKKVWETETEGWKRRGLAAPVNVTWQKLEGWDAVAYDTPVPIGSSAHIRAHWVQAGTWIDVHLSVTSARPLAESRAVLMALLKGMKMKPNQ